MNDEQHIPDDTIQIRLMVGTVAAIWVAGIAAAVSALT
jgi:hypothetical protein